MVYTYEDARKQVNTFDILLCNPDNWFWKAIGHTAMVVRDYEKDIVYVWESTTQGCTGKSGTQLVLFSDWWNFRKPEVWLRKWNNLRGGRFPFMVRLLDIYIQRFRGVPYPDLKSVDGLWYMIKSSLWPDKIRPDKVDLVRRHCTDRVCNTLLHCDILDTDLITETAEPDNMWYDLKNVYKYPPKHWRIDDFKSKQLTLEREVRIK